jgi:predicted dehydrogenase
MISNPTVAIIGAGSRGTRYARLLAAAGASVVAVAEHNPGRRERVAREHGLAEDHVFSDWVELAKLPRLADAVVISTQDELHRDPAVALAGLGYHLLLEKPMAPHAEDARAIASAAEKAGVMLAVCHVLRYTDYTKKIKELIGSGTIGEIVSLQHLEPIGWWHFAHSYVRGNWRREDQSSSMLLAKACHDLDWISHITGKTPVKVSSFGALTHFRADKKPEGAASNCLDCPVEPTCPYSAPRLYLGCLGDPAREEWPLGPVTDDATPEGVLKALREGPYGRCVYACDNDVVDHQDVSLEYADGTTATASVVAFTQLEHRKTRIFGTHGAIDGDGTQLVVDNFVTGKRDVIMVGESGASAADGHGGGDEGLIDAFVQSLRTGDPSHISSGSGDSLDSHEVVWAAEEARKTGQVVALPGR